MKWVNLIPLLIFTALLVGIVFFVRPAAKRRRHEAWEKAGLLPEQVDPELAGKDRPATDATSDVTSDASDAAPGQNPPTDGPEQQR